MSSQLDILAIEPFYGGARRQMLQTLTRHSRHRWKILKLPARRVERRLAASARWFAEIIQRTEIDDMQLIFASEMLNLPDLQRMVPRLGRRPSVVYFHDNQIPAAGETTSGPLDLVNVNSAMAATEIWFNSQYHEDRFLEKTEAMLEAIPEIASRTPISELRGKSLVMPPPLDSVRMMDAFNSGPEIERDPRTLFVDLRGDPRNRNAQILADVLHRLDQRGETYNLITVGSQKGLPPNLRREVISDLNEFAQYRALYEAGIYLAMTPGTTSDELIVAAMSAGCWPVVPEPGLYAELIPTGQHLMCLHDGTADSIVSCILEAWYGERPWGYEAEQQEMIAQRNAIDACQLIDDLLVEVAMGRAVRT